MSRYFEIVTVVADRLDRDTALITLRHIPTKWQLWRGQKAESISYKGQVGQWYVTPQWHPAPEDVAAFLDEVMLSPAYAHLRLKLPK